MEESATQSQQYPDVLSELVDELGIGGLPKQRQDELVLKMSEVLLKRVFLETMEALDEQGRTAYAELVESQATPEQVEAFFKEQISNYDAMVEKVIAEFKEEMLAAGKSNS